MGMLGTIAEAQYEIDNMGEACYERAFEMRTEGRRLAGIARSSDNDQLADVAELLEDAACNRLAELRGDS